MQIDQSASRGRLWHLERGCHGLAVTLPEDETGATVAKRLAAEPALADVPLWTQRVPLAATAAAARAHRQRELSRHVGPDAPGVRVVVVEYADGRADLVLTAARDRLGRAGLRRLAGFLAGAPEPGPALTVPHSLAPSVAWGAPPRALPAEPGWGLGDRRRRGHYGVVGVVPAAGAAVVPDDAGAAPASGAGAVQAAVARVLRAHDPYSPVRFCVVTPGEGADEVVLAGDEATQSSVDILAEPPAVGVLLVDGGGEHGFGPTPPFPVTIVATPDEVWCWYEESYLSPAVAGRFATHLGRALAGQDELVTAGEITDLLAAGRTPAVASPIALAIRGAGTIHAAVAAAGRTRPDAIAYSDETTSLTYAELDEASAAVAAGLREAGVARHALVGVCLSRGANLVVVLLGILRAGATYVPMDVRHPAQRLRFMTRDADVRLVVTDFEEFPVVPGVRTLHPSLLRACGATGFTDTAGGPDDLAYIIYTSGSTGRPKGVRVPHRNVLALLAATAGDMALRPGDVWTWFHSSAFDFAVWEIWGALMTGARLVGVSYEVSRSPEEFYDVLVKERVTVLNQTPSAFGALQRVERTRRPGSAGELALRLVIFGGEPLDVATLGDWFEAHPHTRCRLVNMFGITETTVHVTSRTVTPLDVVRRSRSVGAALPGWSVSVRDEGLRPVPFGVAGEIVVGGAGVADGYLNRPDLTTERFVGDPYGAGRVYRSGDLGRLHPDGSLDHLGRIDSQVQLRGHRVELEEIRAVLLEDPGVGAAAVVVGHAIPGDPDSARLDAYVVAAQGAAVTGTDVRRRVAEFLPEYMVPSTVTLLESMPLTVNGKVDTARLPAPMPGRSTPDPAQPVAEPSDGPEQALRATLRRVWTDVFGGPVTDDDDFFELGGNSLLALRLATGLRESALPAVTMRELYLHPRIDDLVRLLAVRA